MLNVTDLGDGYPIVWIHGFPLASSIFENQLAIRRVRHVMPDLPGFGQSRAPVGDVSMDDYARIALELLDQRGLERAVFAGVSMGGYVCLAIARLAPERMSGLILIDTRETPDSPESAKGRFDLIEKVREQGIAPVVDSMLPKMLSPGAAPEMVARVREIMASSSKDGVMSALRAMATRPDSSETLPKIAVPTLVVVGEHDTITPPSDAERMTALIPGARLLRLPDAGHLSNFEVPEEFNHAVTSFMTTIPRV